MTEGEGINNIELSPANGLSNASFSHSLPAAISWYEGWEVPAGGCAVDVLGVWGGCWLMLCVSEPLWTHEFMYSWFI